MMITSALHAGGPCDKHADEFILAALGFVSWSGSTKQKLTGCSDGGCGRPRWTLRLWAPRCVSVIVLNKRPAQRHPSCGHLHVCIIPLHASVFMFKLFHCKSISWIFFYVRDFKHKNSTFTQVKSVSDERTVLIPRVSITCLTSPSFCFRTTTFLIRGSRRWDRC